MCDCTYLVCVTHVAPGIVGWVSRGNVSIHWVPVFFFSGSRVLIISRKKSGFSYSRKVGGFLSSYVETSGFILSRKIGRYTFLQKSGFDVEVSRKIVFSAIKW